MTELRCGEDWAGVLDGVDTVLFDCDGNLKCYCCKKTTLKAVISQEGVWHINVHNKKMFPCGLEGQVSVPLKITVACSVVFLTLSPGVLWTGTNQAIPGAQEVVKFLRSKVRIIFVQLAIISKHEHAPIIQLVSRTISSVYRESINSSDFLHRLSDNLKGLCSVNHSLSPLDEYSNRRIL